MRKIVFISFLTIVSFLLFVFAFLKNSAEAKDKFTFWTIQLKPVFEEEIKSIISDFEKKHPDYQVVWVDIPIQEAQKRTLASVMSQNPPDLINLNPEFSLVLAQKNILEYFSNYDAQYLNQNLVNQLKYKGEIYALPFYATSSVTVYNKELIKKCNNGIAIKTYDELFLNSLNLKTCTGVSSFVSSLNEGDTLLKILNKYKVYGFKTKEEENKMIEIFSFLNEMYKKEVFPEDVLTINHREAVEKYMSNQALMMVVGANFIKMIKQNAPDIYAKSSISPQLVATSGKFDVSLMNLVIPKKAKNKELAREFAAILTNKDNQLKLSKKTNVLSVNKFALEDEYFKNCSDDLVDLSRCVSAKQLNNLDYKKVEYSNKKELNELLNKTLEEILLDKNSCPKSIEARIKTLFPYLSQFVD